MNKRFLIVISLLSTVIFSSCNKTNNTASVAKIESSATVTAITQEKDVEDYSKKETFTTKNDETSKKTTTKKVDPVDISEDIVYSHMASLTDFSKVGSNEKLEKCLDRLDEICNEYGNAIAFSYENINTGAKINYNSQKQFMTCSTIKAPYIKSILENGINFNDKITKNIVWQGDTVGVDKVASMDMGTEFTAKELIEYSLKVSDNTAYYMLVQNYGWTVFNSLNYKIGANYYLGSDWIFTNATTSDMLKSYKDIYEFGEENEQGKWLTDIMTKTDVDDQISKVLSDKYKVSHKYGSEFNEVVYNDCAIVYADSPYVVCIFTNLAPETEKSNEIFNEIAKIIDDINLLVY